MGQARLQVAFSRSRRSIPGCAAIDSDSQSRYGADGAAPGFLGRKTRLAVAVAS